MSNARGGTSAEPVWDLPIGHLDRAIIDTYIEGVRRLPKRQGKHPDGSDAKMWLRRGLPPQPPETANKKIRIVKTFIRWAIDEKLVSDTALTPLTRALRGTISEPHAGYLAFSLNEVAQILAAASGPRVTKAWQFWAPRIALFTGARVREAADLTVDDIVELAMERLFANGIREIALYDQFNDLLISWPAPRKQATPTRQ